MAKEYIEREAVIELLEEKQRAICPVGRCGHGYVYGRDRDEYDAIEADIDAMQNIPAADVRPVVRGRWVKSMLDDSCVTCSNCLRLKLDGRVAFTPLAFEEWGLNFCPNCGAKMEVQDEV